MPPGVGALGRQHQAKPSSNSNCINAVRELVAAAAVHTSVAPATKAKVNTALAQTLGAFALAGIALYFDLQNGVATNVHIGVIGASAQLERLAAAEAVLNGRTVDAAAIVETAQAAAAAIDPADDTDAPAAYRRALVETLTVRALQRAAARQQ